MTKRILSAAVLPAVLCGLLLSGCSGSGSETPADVTTTAPAGNSTTYGDGTTTTGEFTVVTDADGDTIIKDADGNVIADTGDGDTIVTGDDGSIHITDKDGNVHTIAPTTTTAPQGGNGDETGDGDTDPVPPPSTEDPALTYNGILPGSAEAGTAFSTLAKAPADQRVPVESDTKQFGRFLLTTSDNSGLPFNIACHIGDSRITAVVPASADLSAVKANFTYYGKNVTYNGEELTSRATAMDLTSDATLTLNAQDGSQTSMTVHIEKIATGLPSMTITTSGYSAIASTTEYKSAAFSVGGGNTDVCAYATTEQTRGADCSIKGRGNTSWSYDKKGYTMRFDTKYSLLGLPESKNYVLLALYADQSLARYRLAEYLSETVGLEYTMNLRYVDLWLNGEYAGVYGLVEKIEVEKNRVAITDYVSPSVPVNEMGYLLEFDDHLYTTASEEQRKQWTTVGRGFHDPTINETFFYLDVLGPDWLTIRTTNAKNLTANHVNYIYAVVNNAMTALKAGDYDTISAYIDVESFVKWYLIEEYLNNTDSDMTSSVYMYIDVGGKLTLGPLWDMDNCAGNHTDTADATAHALYDSENGWFSYLFQCSEARAILKDQWAAMSGALDGVTGTLDATASMLGAAAELNFRRWPLLGSHLSSQPAAIADAASYEQQITYLKEYLAQRRTALDAFYNSL